jgi:prevent-host-death family protein
MQKVQMREAKAELSKLVDAAERGDRVTITRHGKPAAVLVSVEDAARLPPQGPVNFAEFLLSFPGPLEIERDTSPPREVDL